MAASEAPITDVAETAEEVPLPAPEAKESDPVSVKTTVFDVSEEKVKSKVPESLVSFKEESNRVSDLRDFEKKALNELKQLVQDAINNHDFTLQPQQIIVKAKEVKEEEETPPTTTKEIPALSSTTTTVTETETETETKTETPKEIPVTHTESEEDILRETAPENENENEVSIITSKKTEITCSTTDKEEEEEEVSIWGVTLLKDDRSDVILLKFLRARDFKVRDAFVMLKNTILWRKEFNIDSLVHQDLGDDLDKVVFMHGLDKDGHPVCYNVYGEFQNKDLYLKTFGDEEKRLNFLRWRIQFLERSIRNLDFTPGGINTIFQVSDLKNSPGPAKRELRIATKQALQLLQDNYPEFVAKQVFINVPWWYLAFYTMISPFLTQRTKSKFVFAGPSKTAETLFKYITPEQVPVQYGGMSVDFCDCNPDFTNDEPAIEITIRPATKQTVEILVNEKCMIVWELRVVGWEVSYGAEYVPSDKGGYAVVIQKATKMAPTDEPVVCNNFKIIEFGKIVLTIDNPTSKKKKLLYRFKVKPYCD